MKDKRTYTHLKEHGEDMTHENESKVNPKEDRSSVKTLGPLPPNTSPISMFHGSRIRELAACGLTLEACCLGLDACRLMLEQVGSKA
jgi:hypothetical protein